MEQHRQNTYFIQAMQQEFRHRRFRTPDAPEYREEGEEKEAWEEDWDDEIMANGWYEGAAFSSAVDPAEGSGSISGSLGGEIPARQEMGHALVTVSDPRGEKETKENDKIGG